MFSDPEPVADSVVPDSVSEVADCVFLVVRLFDCVLVVVDSVDSSEDVSVSNTALVLEEESSPTVRRLSK